MMNDPIQAVIDVLTKYWKKNGSLDAKTKNYCRVLSSAILAGLSDREADQIMHHPEEHSGELANILGRLSRMDPNSDELIKILSAPSQHPHLGSPAIQVTGNNNQVITAGGNITGNMTFLNEPRPRFRNTVTEHGIDNEALQGQGKFTNGYEHAVFVSYALGGDSERVVDELEKAFADHNIRIIRDKKEIGYKGSIEIFEQRIGQGQCIILVVSDKYLRSEHCMYELVEVDKYHNLRERVFPIVLDDARIFKAMDRLAYIKYWDEQIEQLNKAIKDINLMTNLTGIAADLDKYARIRSNFDHLTELLSDMNALTPKMHAANGFATLINAIENVMSGKT